MTRTSAIASIALVFCLCASSVYAQDIAEYSSSVTRSGMAARGSAMPTSGPPTQSPAHLPLRTGPPPDEVNRKQFEQNAGPRAGKLLFRSAPNGADVFVNDLLVGRTPLLLLVAPGKYKVYMRGSREESGRKDIGVLPSETQTVLINLSQKYPATVYTIGK